MLKINNYGRKKIGYAGLVRLSNISTNFEWPGLECDGNVFHELTDVTIAAFKENNLLSEDEALALLNVNADLILFTA
jgi:hypothetical protein